MNSKLEGKSQISRMHELMNAMGSSKQTKNPKILKEAFASNGKIYGVIKENAHYIIKEQKGGGYEYINGLANKTDFRYNSYSEALKQMNLMFGSLNEATNYKQGMDLFEEKRFVLKLKQRQNEQEGLDIEDEIDIDNTIDVPAAPEGKPGMPTGDIGAAPGTGEIPPPPPAKSSPMPTPEPTPAPEPMDRPMPTPTPEPMDRPMPSPRPGPTSTDDVTAPPSGEMDFDAEVASIERELGGGEESPEKEIQSLTGKLGQALRQGEAEQVVDTELTKYVVNSVFSALNLGELNNEDKLEIIKKVKNAGTGEEEPGTPDIPELPVGGPEEEDTEMEIDGLDTGMGDEELDLDDFEEFDQMEEDMLYGDGEAGGSNDEGIVNSLRQFVQNTVDSYIDTRQN